MAIVIWAVALAAILFVVLLIAMGIFYAMLRSSGTGVESPEDGYDGPSLDHNEFICRQCGELVDDPLAESCESCGAIFEDSYECAYCGEVIDNPSELVCPNCGEALVKTVTVCPACNAVVHNEATDCEACGSEFWSPIYLHKKPFRFTPPPEVPKEEKKEDEGEISEEEENQ